MNVERRTHHLRVFRYWLTVGVASNVDTGQVATRISEHIECDRA
jgi:hypothetical protein